ncbi:MAG TPA: hypothetical protein VKA94_02835 [Hyphomicrobiales bacterium]|nr:hypothetical protein [Hyphomicrobiales bacterium]
MTVCLLALLAAGCSSKKDTVTRLEGSEPQRLSFGAPDDVQRAFTDQMRACWFDGPSAPLAGYSFVINPAQFETADGVGKLQQVTIRNDDDESQFVVQFFPFNNNTLISTRNLSMPLELAARLKRDIETWIFGRNDCGDRARLVAEQPTGAPQISASPVQQAPGNGWEARPVDGGANGSTIY